jgi:hypothetical protein
VPGGVVNSHVAKSEANSTAARNENRSFSKLFLDEKKRRKQQFVVCIHMRLVGGGASHFSIDLFGGLDGGELLQVLLVADGSVTLFWRDSSLTS